MNKKIEVRSDAEKVQGKGKVVRVQKKENVKVRTGIKVGQCPTCGTKG